MRYRPEPAPSVDDVNELQTWVVTELNRIADALDKVGYIFLDEIDVEPSKPRDGMIVLADGTNWDPGSGAGFYGRRGGSWVKLG